MPGGVALKFGSEKVSRYTGVSQLQLRVSRYTVQLRAPGGGGPGWWGGGVLGRRGVEGGGPYKGADVALLSHVCCKWEWESTRVGV